MKHRILIPILLLVLATAGTAQVPQHLNYQGRVSVQGVNFNGTGQFKFALVDGGTNLSQTATAAGIATVSITSISIISGGSGYTTPPAVTIAPPDDPGGVQATATATIDAGVVTEITITGPGSGYFTNPVQVTIAPPPENIEHQIYWSNAGDLAPGEVPGTSVSLPVDKGLYSVRLGDTSVPNVAAFNPDIFYTPLYLRVWFNDGVHDFQQLTPDQPLASAPYALQARLAESVAPNSIGGAQIVNGAVGPGKLAAGAVTASLASSGQSAVGSGGIILSSTNNPALAAAGYVKLPAVKFEDLWNQGAGNDALLADPAAVWIGTKLFVWRGGDFGGGLYDPATDAWTPLSGSAPNAPPGYRAKATAIWTGTEVVVWGGWSGVSDYRSDGGRYNPDSNTWTAIPSSLVNAPVGRFKHTAVWTGNKMIVWGGANTASLFDSGGVYDPQANGGAGSWTPTPIVSGTPSARTGHSAVWSGTSMIIWGGETAGGVTDTIGSFSFIGGLPGWESNYASTLSGSPPSPRTGHSTIWTGTEMIVWGGNNFSTGTFYNNGKRLRPSAPFGSPQGWESLSGAS